MDLAHWGLREAPFRITRPPHSLSLLPGQLDALQQIDHAFRDGERVALLIGPHGVGKTIVAQHLVTLCESRQAVTAWAACVPVVGSQALYQMLLADLGQPFQLRSTVELRMQLIDYLLPLVSDCTSVLLVVDEAHHVPLAILEELRPLIEMVSPEGLPGVHLLLSGTFHLQDQFDQSPEYGLRSWIGCRAALNRLTTEQSLSFLYEQWKASGGEPRRHATDEAWSMLAEMGQGMPLIINRLARRAFRLAEHLEQSMLDAEVVWEAAHDLGLITDESDAEKELTVPLPVRGSLKESA